MRLQAHPIPNSNPNDSRTNTHKAKADILIPYILALFLGAAALSTPAVAQTAYDISETQVGDLVLKGAFIRETMPRAPVGSAYVTITNRGATDDRLVSVSAAFADKVVVHEMVQKNDIMSMLSLPDGLLIPAGETFSLIPGVTHMMIYGLDAPLVRGQTAYLTLTFEEAGDVSVGFDILKLNARSHPDMNKFDQQEN
jgi:copper(I)-binding protein